MQPQPQELNAQDLISLFCLLIDRSGGKVIIDRTDELDRVLFRIKATPVPDKNTIIIEAVKFAKVEAPNATQNPRLLLSERKKLRRRNRKPNSPS